MSAPATLAYRLATPAQWRGGELARVQIGADGLYQPFAPFAPGRALGPAAGADLAAIGLDGSAWWRGAGALYRLRPGAAQAEVMAPDRFACARVGLAAGRSLLWVAGGADGRLHCYAQDDLRRLFTVDLDDARVLGIALAACEGLWVLAQGAHGQRIVRLDQAGRVRASIPLRDQPPLAAIAALGRAGWLALLARDGSRVVFVAGGAADPVPPPLALDALEAGAGGRLLVSDGEDLLYIGIRDRNGANAVLACSASGGLFTRIALDAAPDAIAAGRAQLLAAGAGGAILYRSDAARVAASASCELITPVLRSPTRADGRGWLRAELSVRLPAGAALTVSYTGTDDLKAGRPHSWSEPVRYTGSAGATLRTLAAPLFDARSEYLWLRIGLEASAGGALPALGPVRVLYPDRSLMEALPAIYRNEERQDFMRTIVGVLEATTQDLDRRIAGLGRLLDPATTEPQWLDYMARWFDLPWDDALETGQKRALLRAAPDILPLRGTRQALETMLACLFPGEPRRFRVSDVAAALGPAQVGRTALPALLSGLPASSPVLGRRALVGHTRLGDAAALALPARIRIEITASQAERDRAALWLRPMVDALMPVTARAELVWREARADGSGLSLGEDMVLGEAPDARLGANSVIGAARLRPGQVTRLPASGATVGFRLG
jgi:phage tail-like protein